LEIGVGQGQNLRSPRAAIPLRKFYDKILDANFVGDFEVWSNAFNAQ
jgi:hypothetical protein